MGVRPRARRPRRRSRYLERRKLVTASLCRFDLYSLLVSKTERHGVVSSPFFILKQLSTLVASGMELAQSLKASGVQATLCAAVPRFSCASASVEQNPIPTKATKSSLSFDISGPFSQYAAALSYDLTDLPSARNEGEASARTPRVAMMVCNPHQNLGDGPLAPMW
jgi:hypothetical protein